MELVEPPFGEQDVVPKRTLRIFGVTLRGRHYRISEASIVSVLDVDDCPLLGQVVWDLVKIEALQRDYLRPL